MVLNGGKKVKKIIRFVVTCFCLILLTDNISASVNGNSTAYCVGTDYGSFDIDDVSYSSFFEIVYII